MAEITDTQHSLRSLLYTEERDFLIRNNGEKVKVDDLEGKTVGLYFSAHWCRPCKAFTPTLAEIYTELVDKGSFEIIFVSDDEDESSFQEYHKTMPWLALPFGDAESRDKLDQVFDVSGIPTLVFVDKEGKVISADGVDIIDSYGAQAYPFSKERLDQLKAEEDAMRQNQSLTSLLVSPARDFVIANGDRKVPVSELKGKTVGLYFSAHWCPPCRAFTPMLAKVYNKLKEKGEAFEIVFLSSDKDQEAFEEYHASMPWLALPFGEKVKKDLGRYFHIEGIPTLIIIGPDGKTVTTDGRNIVSVYGAKAYPFTDARLAELEKEIEEQVERWPKEVNHNLHEHSLSLTQRQTYICNGCDKEGGPWSFCCEECDFDLHPDCALEDEGFEECDFDLLQDCALEDEGFEECDFDLPLDCALEDEGFEECDFDLRPYCALEDEVFEECDFDLHPNCALEDEGFDTIEKQHQESKPSSNENKPTRFICEGDVCRRV